MILPKNYLGLRFHMACSVELEIPQDSYPQKYFQFAICDLKNSGSERCRVNALSNAKRSLHFQIELVTRAFGIERLGKKKNKDFYSQLEFCQKCGIVSPQILKRLNKLRNTVEHDYYIPKVEEVENFVDVVELFLNATDKYLKRFPIEHELEFDSKLDESSPDISQIHFPAEKGEVQLFVFPSPEIAKKELKELDSKDYFKWVRKHSIIFDPTQSEYYEWVKCITN